MRHLIYIYINIIISVNGAVQTRRMQIKVTPLSAEWIATYFKAEMMILELGQIRKWD